MSKMSKIKIAITGTIGSGKTSVKKIISKTYKTISADEIVSELYKKPEVIKTVNKEILNIDCNVIDKSKLANTIFNDRKLKLKLEAIIHPLVKESIKSWLNDNDGLIFVEVPLLYEAHFEDLFDQVIVVVTDQDKIIARLTKNRGYSKADTLLRLNQQLNVKEKIKRADYVVYNNETYKDLINEVSKVLRKIEIGD